MKLVHKRGIVTQIIKTYGNKDDSLYWGPKPTISVIIDSVKRHVKLEITLLP